MGEYALHANTSGEKNTGMGWYALRANTTGIDNTAFGKGGLMNNTTGTYNTSLGVDALAANKTGDYNHGSRHRCALSKHVRYPQRRQRRKRPRVQSDRQSEHREWHVRRCTPM